MARAAVVADRAVDAVDRAAAVLAAAAEGLRVRAVVVLVGSGAASAAGAAGRAVGGRAADAVGKEDAPDAADRWVARAWRVSEMRGGTGACRSTATHRSPWIIRSGTQRVTRSTGRIRPSRRTPRRART